jgi:hypothetical protein
LLKCSHISQKRFSNCNEETRQELVKWSVEWNMRCQWEELRYGTLISLLGFVSTLHFCSSTSTNTTISTSDSQTTPINAYCIYLLCL